MAQHKYGWRIAGFIFKGLCTLLIIGMIAILAWRIIDRSISPVSMKQLTPNDKICEAYIENKNKLTLYTQEQNEYTQEEHNYGYFANGGSCYVKEAAQVQFVLRYNNSTLKNTAKDFELDKQPEREANVFDVTLVIMYDLTPDNKEDNDGKTPDAVRYERIQPTSDPLSYQKTLYNYRKFFFDGVTIDKSVLAIYADIYYINEVNYEEKSFGTLLLYYYDDPYSEYYLSSDEVDAIENYIETNKLKK